MVYSLTYRRPAYVDTSRVSLETEKSAAEESVSSQSSSHPPGIPDALSFKKIVNGETYPVRIPPPKTSLHAPDGMPHPEQVTQARGIITNTALAMHSARIHGFPLLH